MPPPTVTVVYSSLLLIQHIIRRYMNTMIDDRLMCCVPVDYVYTLYFVMAFRRSKRDIVRSDH